jgi:hypothetical protein
MGIRLTCLVMATAAACGGTGENSALDGGGLRDDGGSAEVDGATDTAMTPGPDDASSMEASASFCLPDGAAANAAAVGAPCVPSTEEDPLISGFDVSEVNLDSKNSACASGVCLVNHFQGRVTCPDGQSASGQGPDGAPGCRAPGSCDPVTVQVPPQCTDRPAAAAVYCSCRCANAAGQTDDGDTYCTCPGTMMCVQVSSGGYCIKAGTGYDASAPCQ